ncbi:MAG TPA: hypothetical protein VK623_06790 [Flavobacterium sp.]|nr:hypothetical protein [Flavobacterium sp.]
MCYTKLSIKKNNKTRKYIIFYADYLNEAWLSEVVENDTTKIIKQFICKNENDLDILCRYISRKGELINLSGNHSANDYLAILENKLATKTCKSVIPGFIKFGMSAVPYRMFWNRLTHSFFSLGLN